MPSIVTSGSSLGTTIQTAELDDSAVTTAKINNEAVTADKIKAGATYTYISTTTIESAGDLTITVPTGYKQLLIIGQARSSTSGQSIFFQFNNDTGSNYTRQVMRATSSTLVANVSTTTSFVCSEGVSTSVDTNFIIDIKNVASETKGTLIRSGRGNYYHNVIGEWSNASDEISTIKIQAGASETLQAGANFMLYGIKS